MKNEKENGYGLKERKGKGVTEVVADTDLAGYPANETRYPAGYRP